MNIKHNGLIFEDNWTIQDVSTRQWTNTITVRTHKTKDVISLLLNDKEICFENESREIFNNLNSKNIEDITVIYEKFLSEAKKILKEQEDYNEKLINSYIFLKSDNLKSFGIKACFKMCIILETLLSFIKNPKNGISIKKTSENFINEKNTTENIFILKIFMIYKNSISDFKNNLGTINSFQTKKLYALIEELEFTFENFISAKNLEINQEVENLQECYTLRRPKIFWKIEDPFKVKINIDSNIFITKEFGIEILFGQNGHLMTMSLEKFKEKDSKIGLSYMGEDSMILDFFIENYNEALISFNKFLSILKEFLNESQEFTNEYIEEINLQERYKYFKNIFIFGLGNHLKSWKYNKIINNNIKMIFFLKAFRLRVENFINSAENKLKTNENDKEKIEWILKIIKKIEIKLRRLIETKNNLIKASECLLNDK